MQKERNYERYLLKRVFKEVFPRDVNFHMTRQRIRLKHNTAMPDWLTHNNGTFIRDRNYTNISHSYKDEQLPRHILLHHEPTRSLRSSISHQLSVSHHNLTFGSRAFRFSAPRAFIIHYLSASVNLSLFLLSDVILRHFTFSQLLTLPRISLSMSPILLRLWHYIRHLLTHLNSSICLTVETLLLLLLSYALGAITGQPGNGIIVCRV